MEIKILHINDLHSRFEEFAKITSLIKAHRTPKTLVMDAGDNADFMRVETMGTEGRISSGLLKEAGFNVRTFGNNESFAGIECMKIIAETSGCPVVSCNAYDLEGKRISSIKPYEIIELSGVRILIIGSLPYGGPNNPFSIFFSMSGVKVTDPVLEIKKILSEINREDYDLVVLLSHLGIDRDKAIAEKIPEIQIIVGGHSHTVIESPVLVNHTIIVQAGHYGQYLGELTIEYNTESRSIDNFSGRLIPSEGAMADEKIIGLIKEYGEEADITLSKPLYNINCSLTHSLSQENEIGNLLADGLLDTLKTDFGIINSGVLNGGVEKGEVSKKLLLSICPSPLNPTSIEIKGRDILFSLEKSLLPEFYNALGKGPGFRGKWLGNLQVSHNVKVRFSPSAEAYKKIIEVTIDGKPLEPDKWYTAATSDYLQRGTGYEEMGRGRNEKYNPEYLRDTLRIYLNEEGFIKRAFEKRFESV